MPKPKPEPTPAPEIDLGIEDMALNTLAGDLRDRMLTRFRQTRKPWAKMSEIEQTETANAFELAARDLVRGAVRLLTRSEFPHVVVRIGDVAVKGGNDPRIEAKVRTDREDENLSRMGHHVGQMAMLLFVDSEMFLGTRGAAAVDPDEPPLPLPEPDADDSALGEQYREGEAHLACRALAEESLAANPAEGPTYTDEEIEAIVAAVTGARTDLPAEHVGAWIAWLARGQTGLDPSAAAEADRAAEQWATGALAASPPANGQAYSIEEIERIAAGVADTAKGEGLDADRVKAAALRILNAHPDAIEDPGTGEPMDGIEVAADGTLTELRSEGGEALPESTPESPAETREPGAMPESTPENPGGGFTEATPEELERQPTRRKRKAEREAAAAAGDTEAPAEA